MSCINNHGEENIQEHDGRRVCMACRQKYLAESNKRRVKAIQQNQRTKGRENKKAARQRQYRAKNRKAAQQRIINRHSAETPHNVGSFLKEKNNERDNH